MMGGRTEIRGSSFTKFSLDEMIPTDRSVGRRIDGVRDRRLWAARCTTSLKGFTATSADPRSIAS